MATPTMVPIDLQRVRPNELGKMMILEYHLIGEPEGRWQRTPHNFRNDLEYLYKKGYRLISLRDFLDNNVTVPAGTTPVMLTFDDSSPGQMRYLVADGEPKLDSQSAVGIMVDFAREHPDFGLEATFFVLPEAAQPNRLFGQRGFEERKLRHIVELGMDLGNHTWWHQTLHNVDDKEVQRQLAFAVRDVERAVPGYVMDVLSLPLGAYPQRRELAFGGEYDGVRYYNRAALLVGAEPAPAPNHTDYDAKALPRIQAFQEQLDLWFGRMDKEPSLRYVSDGDPNTISFPKKAAGFLKEASLAGKQKREY